MTRVTPKEAEDEFITADYCLLERVISEKVQGTWRKIGKAKYKVGGGGGA